MEPWIFFGGFAALFLIRLIVHSKAAEFRTDRDAGRDGGMGNDIDAIRNRLSARNYRREGRGWYVAMLATQVLLMGWALVGGILLLTR
jgi:hypothetical protein